MSTKSVLVPLDGSVFGEGALPSALAVARRLGVGVELLSVYEDEPRVGGWLISAAGAKDWFEEYHRDVTDRIARVSDVPLSSTVMSGPMPRGLEAYAEHEHVELVAMSTHGRGPLSRAWLGSVADHVVRHVSMPVLVVRPPEEPQSFAERAPFKRILVPLDGSERAESSVSWALRLGRDRCAEYAFVRAVPPLFALTSAYLPHAVNETKEILERGREEAEKYLADLERRFRDEELDVTTHVLLGVSPGWGIVRYAEDNGFDVIVVATHGRSGLPRLVLGSVADKIVRGSSIPVMVLRPPEP